MQKQLDFPFGLLARARHITITMVENYDADVSRGSSVVLLVTILLFLCFKVRNNRISDRLSYRTTSYALFARYALARATSHKLETCLSERPNHKQTSRVVVIACRSCLAYIFSVL